MPRAELNVLGPLLRDLLAREEEWIMRAGEEVAVFPGIRELS